MVSWNVNVFGNTFYLLCPHIQHDQIYDLFSGFMGLRYLLSFNCFGKPFKRVLKKDHRKLLTGCFNTTKSKTQSTEVSHWSVLIESFSIHPGICLPSELHFAVVDSFPFLQQKSQVTQYIQTLRWPMSTHAPWLESFCFPGYHLGFRKHSFMVAGLLPAGPMVINQDRKWYPPLRLLQTLCVGRAAGGLVLDGCFLLIQSKNT